MTISKSLVLKSINILILYYKRDSIIIFSFICTYSTYCTYIHEKLPQRGEKPQ
jgi:hypothetical protein